MLTDQPVVRRKGELLEARVEEELVGLDVEQGACYGFNATATRIWMLIEQPMRVAELRDALLRRYDVEPERCERELAALLRELAGDGLVEFEAPGA